MSSRFDEAVLNRDVKMLQAIINNSFIIDPTTKTIQKMLKKIEDNNINIFEPHDNKILNEEKIYWTRDYEKQLLSELFLNFSHERFDLLLELVPYVEEDYIKQQQEKLSKNNEGENDKNIEKKIIKFVFEEIMSIMLRAEKKLPKEKINHILVKLGEKLIEMGKKE